LVSQVLDCPLCVNAAIQHLDEVVGTRKNKLDVVCDEDLQGRAVSVSNVLRYGVRAEDRLNKRWAVWLSWKPMVIIRDS
jgi:hypothetical protein